ncbi:MAG TPA: heparinase II/III family protein [Candidatus Sumerlaeota bacterium]|nr:heparinase II/III family protein [Candidatus Sumerlaeota bacterium]
MHSPRFSSRRTVCCLTLTAFLLTPLVWAASTGANLDPKRIEAIAALLPEKPTGFGKPISDRAAWEALGKQLAFRKIVARAELLLSTPFPDSPDELYLEFSVNGNRENYQKVAEERRSQVQIFTLAECVENQGNYLPALEEVINELCLERTWVLPAHDKSLENFDLKTTDIDLVSSALAWELAMSDYLLGDKLKPEVRDTIRRNVEVRILNPFRQMATGIREENFWLRTTNNWNAVCLAGVTGSALALLDKREDRAFFAAAAEFYIKNFLKGFTPDGYCSEGVSYWNYGFGHYVLLTEALRQATGGRLDLMEAPEARPAALYGTRIEIQNGICPAFADCPVNAKPDPDLLAYLDHRYGLGLNRKVEPGVSGSLFETLFYSCPAAFPETKSSEPRPAVSPEREWFADAGVYIGRPDAKSEPKLAVALKGGHNAEHHNHNDVGSYQVVLNNAVPLVDPGSEVYTARTFSDQRYESQVLNSFGHPVPRVAGKLQETGRKAEGQIVREDFSGMGDTLIVDLKSAYAVPELQRLERTFTYLRSERGRFIVSDLVAFNNPEKFETALITFGTSEEVKPGVLEIREKGEVLRVTIETGGKPFDLVKEVLSEDLQTDRKPTRIAIRLRNPVLQATVRLTMEPVVAP